MQRQPRRKHLSHARPITAIGFLRLKCLLARRCAAWLLPSSAKLISGRTLCAAGFNSSSCFRALWLRNPSAHLNSNFEKTTMKILTAITNAAPQRWRWLACPLALLSTLASAQEARVLDVNYLDALRQEVRTNHPTIAAAQ